MTIAATERPGVATPSEKLEARLTRWSSPSGLTFNNEAARAAYQQRVQLFKDIIRLRKPERVPICPNVGFFVMAYAGITSEEAMYDYEKLGQAVRKFNTDFECDTITSSIIYGPGKLFELLDYKLYRWPGHGVPATTSYQCQESTYMRGDEYDTLIADPSSYFLHHYLPRIFGEFAPWLSMPAFTDIVELPMVGGAFVPFGLPEMQRTLTKLQEAGTAALEWINACTEIDNEIAGRQGLPSWIGGFSKAPFDTLGDTMRGTRGIMVDKFQRPDKILEAMERLVPLAVDMGVRNANATGNPVIMIPLHKGADGFMSTADFRNFYWPTLRAVILGLVQEGVLPCMFVEGGYNERLDVLADSGIPEATTLWLFDKTDMKQVKKKIGSWAAFMGNVPVSLLKAAEPAEVRDYVHRLIDDVAGDGGFILSNGAVLDNARPENLRAMIDAAQEYGSYR